MEHYTPKTWKSLAQARITKTILNNENSILQASSLVNDYYGINDVYLSIPAVVNRNGIFRIMPVELNDQETKAFQKSAEVLKKIINESGL